MLICLKKLFKKGYYIMEGSKNTGMRTKRLTHVFIPMDGEEGVHECAEAW